MQIFRAIDVLFIVNNKVLAWVAVFLQVPVDIANGIYSIIFPLQDFL
jgi:hypothetical protein